MHRLTPAELHALTGLRQGAAQVKMLRKMGIRCERNALGEVVVLREWLTQDARAQGESEPELNL